MSHAWYDTKLSARNVRGYIAPLCSAINPFVAEPTSCQQIRNVVTPRLADVTSANLPTRNVDLTSLPIARIVLILKAELFFAGHRSFAFQRGRVQSPVFLPHPGCVLLFALLQPVQPKPTDKSSIPQPTAA